jgi:flavin-dependent dehydrogenase
VRSDIEGHYLRAATAIPELADRIEAARRVEPFYGMADVPNFFRKPFGPGWALVGDAGHHKDPTPAYGISDAFCDAELLAEAVHAGLTGVLMDTALADYEQQRNARAIPDHEETLMRSRLHSWNTPEMMGLRAALRDNPADTRDFLAVIAKAHPREAFFAPENLARIMRQAALAPRPL